MTLLSYTRRTAINRPPEAVFHFLSDLRHELDWNPDAKEVEKLTEGPIGVGTRFRARWSRTRPTEVEIIRYEPPMAWATRSGALGMEVIASGRVTAAASGSRYSIHLELRPRGVGRLLAPVMKVMMERGEARNMRLVREALEGPSRVSRSTGLSLRERLVLLIHRQLDRRLSPFGVWLMRRTRGSLAAKYKVEALVLTTTGRRSGRPRSVVLQYFPDGDGMVVVATNDGGATHPAWYLNLTSSPRAQVEIGGRHVQVAATEVSGDEATSWWRRILERAPDYERYSRAARRAFPIVRLTPV